MKVSVHKSYSGVDKNYQPITDHSDSVNKIKGIKHIIAYVAVRIFNDGLHTLNQRALKLFIINPKAKVLDLGTGDTKLLLYFNKSIGSKSLYAIDSNPLSTNKVKILKSNLEDEFPYKSNMFDIIISSQNIEHIINTPQYISEIKRVLKKDGYVVVLTENLSSWANIFCLIVGYIPFSLTNMFGTPFGNRLVWHEKFSHKYNLNEIASKNTWGSIGHQRIFTITGLIELFKKNKFDIDEIISGGYFPTYGFIQDMLSKIDKTHSHFIGFKFRNTKDN